MGIIEYLKSKRKEKELPLIARLNLAELQEQRENELQNTENSILAAEDYAKKIPALRLYYVALEKFTSYGTNETKIGQTYGISSPFRLPHNMSMEDACKVVSYLSDKVENENDLEPACEKSVMMVSNILENYGFSKVEDVEKGHCHGVAVSEYTSFHKIQPILPMCKKMDGVVDLFTVNGDQKLFKKFEMNSRYFEWYTEGVTKDEIDDIYQNINCENLLSKETDSSQNEIEM